MQLIHFERKVETAAILGVFAIFLLLGIYGSNTTMVIEMLGPADGTMLKLAPVELVARVTVRGVPTANVSMKYAILNDRGDRLYLNSETDEKGVSSLILPIAPGNYSWSVTASKEGYPTIRSPSAAFGAVLRLQVEGLFPSRLYTGASPINFKARVTDLASEPIESANVTFYLDSEKIGWNLTQSTGIATFLYDVASGSHTWFASASKGGEGGASLITRFIATQTSSTATAAFGVNWEAQSLRSPELEIAALQTLSRSDEDQ